MLILFSSCKGLFLISLHVKHFVECSSLVYSCYAHITRRNNARFSLFSLSIIHFFFLATFYVISSWKAIVSLFAAHLIFDPGLKISHFGIDAIFSCHSASITPACSTLKVPLAIELADHGSSTVSLTRVHSTSV